MKKNKTKFKEYQIVYAKVAPKIPMQIIYVYGESVTYRYECKYWSPGQGKFITENFYEEELQAHKGK